MATTGGFTITIDGSAIPADLMASLVSAHVDTSTALPDAFTLRFRDPGRTVLVESKAKIGAIVTISVVTDHNPEAEQLIDGEVTAVEADFEKSGTFTTIRGYDQSHRLFRARHTASYTQATAADAATQCARRAGLKPGSIEPSPTVFEHISQRGQTDWEFLNALARDIGYEVAVRDGALDFAPPARADSAPAGDPENPLSLQYGTDIIRLRSTLTAAQQVSRVEMRGWDVATKRPIVGTAEATTASAQVPGIDPAHLASTFSSPVYVGNDSGLRTQTEADTAAAARSATIAGVFAEIDAVAQGNPNLRAGSSVSLENLGQPFDGKFVVSSARHRFDPASGFTTMFAVSSSHDRSLLGLTATPGGTGGQGVVIGQVTDVNDPESAGRVKLTFPQLSDDYVSGWARTVQAGAGKDRGVLILPEVGDEVLVAFEQGNADHPYVLGGLFNGVDTPDSKGVTLVDPASGVINRRSLVSRLGHRIDLNDEGGRTEGVVLSSVSESVRIELDAIGSTVTVHSDGKVHIEGKTGVVIDAGAGELELRGQKVSLKASTTAELTASGPVTVQGTPIKLN